MIKAEYLSTQVFKNIVDIINTNLTKGDKLLTEREYAEEFQVSRTVIREALKALEIIGAISRKQGQRAIVVRPSIVNVWGTLNEILGSYESYEELLHVRMLLEVEAIKLVCEKHSEDDIIILEKYNDLMEQTIEKEEYYIPISFKFHKSIIRDSKNKILLAFWDLISDLLTEAMKISYEVGRTKNAKMSLIQHKKILAAIKERDTETAVLETIKHIDTVNNNIRKGLLAKGNING